MTTPPTHGDPRAIPPEMNPATVAQIDARLGAVEREHGVRIAFAIESGSRAWGFPSPDSDYDCRFVFIRPRASYIALYPKRDVIETEMTPLLDPNGWDIAKAIRLLESGNAVMVEWLTSPIVYRALPGVRDTLRTLAGEIGSRQAFAMHYLHLARRQLPLITGGPDNAPLKKIFYVLRPALALRWLRLHPDAKIAPMHFPTLCQEADLDPGLTFEITGLLQQKSVTRELGTGPVPPRIAAIISGELGRAEADHPPIHRDRTATQHRAEVEFRRLLEQHAP